MELPVRLFTHIPWLRTRTLFYLNYCFLRAFPLFLHSLTETCSRTSTVARLRSQNGFSYVKTVMPSSLSVGMSPLPYLLTPSSYMVRMEMEVMRKHPRFRCGTATFRAGAAGSSAHCALREAVGIYSLEAPRRGKMTVSKQSTLTGWGP